MNKKAIAMRQRMETITEALKSQTITLDEYLLAMKDKYDREFITQADTGKKPRPKSKTVGDKASVILDNQPSQVQLSQRQPGAVISDPVLNGELKLEDKMPSRQEDTEEVDPELFLP